MEKYLLTEELHNIKFKDRRIVKVLNDNGIFIIKDIFDFMEYLNDFEGISTKRLEMLKELINPYMSIKDNKKFDDIIEVSRQKRKRSLCEYQKRYLNKKKEREKIEAVEMVSIDDKEAVEMVSIDDKEATTEILRFSPEELEVIELIISSSMVNSHNNEIKKSILEKIQSGKPVMVQNYVNNNFVHNPIQNQSDNILFSWIGDGIYHTGKDIKYVVSETLKNMNPYEDGYNYVADFNADYVIGVNYKPISNIGEYKLIYTNDKIIAVKKK